MSDETDAQMGEPTAVFQINSEGPLSVTEATNAIANARVSAQKPLEETPPEPAKPEPAKADPPVDENAAPPEEAPGEPTPEPDAAEELPPVEPPRSWSKEEKERFTTLPRETQEYLSERERARETDFNRRQQEATEQRKAAEAERVRAEQARQQYEQTLPQVLATVQSQFASEFADIKTWEDVEKLQAEDPFRYQRFDLSLKKAQALKQEAAKAQGRQDKEIAQKWSDLVKTEDVRFSEKVPESADPEKLRALQKNSQALLDALGFTKDELTDAWNGKTGISMRDHRVQLLIRKAALFDQQEAKAKTIRQAPVPPAQKPGAARSAAAVNETEIKNITKELSTATGRKAIELATKLQQMKRTA